MEDKGEMSSLARWDALVCPPGTMDTCKNTSAQGGITF